MRFSSLFAVLAVILSTDIRAGEFDVPSLKSLDEGQNVRIVPSRVRGAGFALSAFRRGSLDLDEAMRRSFGLTRVSQGDGSRSYKLLVGGIPVCGYQVRADVVKGNDLIALGRVPTLDRIVPTADAEWPAEARVFDVAAAQLSHLLAEASVKAADSERCYVVRDGALRPAWKFHLVARGKPYVAIADEGRTHQIERLFLEVADGSANVYPENAVATPTRSVLALKGLTADTLDTEFLTTTVNSGHTRASEATHVFDYAPSDDRFAEVSAFTHTIAHLEFFKSLGFAWYSEVKPLVLQIHKKPGSDDNNVGGSPNNALFTPGYAGEPPMITIGDGDGSVLKNLPLDGDVVSHELGHLLIFKNILSTSGESLVLHEGLADFFAFARTGNACLGESSCPSGSSACILEAQCLRSGELSLKYEDDQWNEWAGSGHLGHLHGQLFSGFLWDLKKSGEVPLDTLTKTVFKAISYLPENATFENFMDALITANNVISGANYDSAIRLAAKARGLEALLPDGVPPEPTGKTETETGTGTGTGTGEGSGTGTGTIGNTDPVAPAPAPQPDEGAPQDSGGSKKKKDPFPPCGVVAQMDKAPDHAGAWMLLLVLALPVVVGGRAVPARLTSRRASANPGKRT